MEELKRVMDAERRQSNTIIYDQVVAMNEKIDKIMDALFGYNGNPGVIGTIAVHETRMKQIEENGCNQGRTLHPPEEKKSDGITWQFVGDFFFRNLLGPLVVATMMYFLLRP